MIAENQDMLMVNARACVCALVRASRITDTDGYARQKPEMTEIAGNAEPRNQEIPLDDLNEASERNARRGNFRSLRSPPSLPTPDERERTWEGRELGKSLACQTRLLSF